jgi:hypothetical protein
VVYYRKDRVEEIEGTRRALWKKEWCTQRDRERRPYMPVGPASWTMGTDNLKLCTIGKKIFRTGPTGSAGQFFMLPPPSTIHRLNSVSVSFVPKLVSYMSYVSRSLYIQSICHTNSVLSGISHYFIGIH